ncbi:MAG: DUF1828 domain-containing protein [Planctomycetota bacterium]
MFTREQLEERLAHHCMVAGFDFVRKGHFRIETRFLYPDGDSVDLFVPRHDAATFEGFVTDFGRTAEWLMHAQVKPWMSKKRSEQQNDILHALRVRQEGGALAFDIVGDNVDEAIVRLGQACVRVADLVLTRRSSLVVPFNEQVEEVLVDIELPYESGVDVQGRFGPVRMDFRVTGPTTTSGILALGGSANTSSAHGASNEVFKRWYDLLGVPTLSRVTVFDDSVDVYREEDLQRLRTVSDVVGLSERRTLQQLLAA